jgi:hypothetical protein
MLVLLRRFDSASQLLLKFIYMPVLEVPFGLVTLPDLGQFGTQ